MLFENVVDVLDARAATSGDATLARPVDEVGILAFILRHGVDDDGHLAKHAVVDLGALGVAKLIDARQAVQHAFGAAEIGHLPQLVAEVGQVEPPAAADLVGEPGGLLAIDLAFRLLDKRQHIAHAEDPRCHAVRMKGFDGVGLLANA